MSPFGMLDWPRWAWMWVLAAGIFWVCKGLTWWRTPAIRARSVRPAMWTYLLGWPGMDAPAFARPASLPRPTMWEWLFALGKVLTGLALLFGAARWVQDRHANLYSVGWVGMVGIVMVLHFGIFHLLSCAWRRLGLNARPVMNNPLASVSVSEFWGKRWNLAFRDLTHRFLFRPLACRLGPGGALAVVFLCSGFIHDVVISLPAGGGYGLPTVYFTLQGAALFLERGALGRRCGLTAGWQGWLFTAGVVLGPICLLFHPPFVEGVIVPFMQALGAVA